MPFIHDSPVRAGQAPGRRSFLLLGLAGLAGLWSAAPAAAQSSAGAPPRVEVFKNPSCGCCGAWVEHLQAAGFQVRVSEVADTAVPRRQFGMPDKFGSCHTARVGGYVLEGHVPAQDVRRLLATRPAALGLAVPGMPAGSPGMENGGRRDAFEVLLVDRSGQGRVFATYPALPAAHAATRPTRT